MNVELMKNPIIIGARYHTTWQKVRKAYWRLDRIEGDTAFLVSGAIVQKTIQTPVDTLIFKDTSRNRNWANKLIKKDPSRLWNSHHPPKDSSG